MSLLKKLIQSFIVKVKLKDLPHSQRFKIYRSVILLNILFIVVLAAFSFKIHTMLVAENDDINSQISVHSNNKQEINLFRSQYHKEINAKLFLLSQRLIDIRSEIMPIEFELTMNYPESWVSTTQSPEIDLQDGGFIKNHVLYYHNVVNGEVQEAAFYEGTILTNFSSTLYPLDKQIVVISLGTLKPNEVNTDLPYLYVNEFQDQSYFKKRNYQLIRTDLFNQINAYSLPIGNQTKAFRDMRNTAYLLYDHKNLKSYLKVTQYIIFSILIAVFALLINPKIGSAISGRISVIGSSVFSLSANIFQVNSLIKPVSGITLIDLMTAFAGIMILACFLITTRTVKLNDQYGHEASKLYDMIVFKFMLFYAMLFFTITYLQT